ALSDRSTDSDRPLFEGVRGRVPEHAPANAAAPPRGTWHELLGTARRASAGHGDRSCPPPRPPARADRRFPRVLESKPRQPGVSPVDQHVARAVSIARSAAVIPVGRAAFPPATGTGRSVAGALSAVA